MQNVSDKLKKSPDFFIESTIPFTIKQQEYAIKLGIFGAIEIQGGHLVPKVSGYQIIEVKKQKQKIELTKDISSEAHKWIENNPMRFEMIVNNELKIMTMLTATPPNKSPLSNNSLDNC